MSWRAREISVAFLSHKERSKKLLTFPLSNPASVARNHRCDVYGHTKSGRRLSESYSGHWVVEWS
jgi:hypothetical protein